MAEQIIISEKVKSFIPSDLKTGYSHIVAHDLINEVNVKLSGNDGPVFVLFFISDDELEPLADFLKESGNKNIFYRAVVLGLNRDVNSLNPENFPVISEYRNSPISEKDLGYIVDKSFSQIREDYNKVKILSEYIINLDDTRQDQEDLINIGKSLSSEKDPDQLLTLILFLSKKITGADAGSIYLVEFDEQGVKRLRFKYSHTHSREIPLEEFVMAMNKKSIAGYTAVTGSVLNIPNAYTLPEDAPYSFNSSFDEQNNYVCRSMLVVPMRNHIDEIIGVIQLINSKEELDGKSCSGNEAFTIMLENREDFDRYVVPFNKKYDSLLEAIAGQAAVAIENNRMIKQIQNQFKEFVRASVTAIESRDPATSGHSFRVADTCKMLANAVNGIKEGYLKDYSFDETTIQELEFAALLHDFGKVYIDNSIFKKEKKLFPKDFENLKIRIDYLYRYAELKYSNKKCQMITEGRDFEIIKNDLLQIEEEKTAVLERIKSVKDKIILLNEPTVMEMDPEKTMADLMDEIKDLACLDINNNVMDIITENDRLNLTIKKGSLNPMERREIETHVSHTYSFVSKIPWPPEYMHIPEIALRHHEAIDGSGYPDGIKGREKTSLQSRMVSIADIFDALTAQDRPYKKAVPIERVLKILKDDADRGKLDSDLVDLFISEKIYEKIKL